MLLQSKWSSKVLFCLKSIIKDWIENEEVISTFGSVGRPANFKYVRDNDIQWFLVYARSYLKYFTAFSSNSLSFVTVC